MKEPIGRDPLIEEAVKQLITLAEASEMSGLSHGHISLLINRGIVWGVKVGMNWMTTKDAIESYMAIERRPGPKRKTGA